MLNITRLVSISGLELYCPCVVVLVKGGLVLGARKCGGYVNSKPYFSMGEYRDPTGEIEWWPIW